MKKIIKCLVVGFMIIGVLMSAVSCSHNIEDYKDYRCYDYHLIYLNTSKSIGTYKQEEDNVIYNLNYKKIKNLPTILLRIFICLIVVVSLIISANKMMEYLSIREENKILESIIENKKVEIDELKYYINTEIDDEYKERMARLLGYCYPDEIIYYIE